ncbi:hypothetical protein F5984_25320 [Rudanella paleaurantiibacter]|uniref:PIN domain-containing protein n=1 Tax=Rudanella paleaurantiibacter TaxID=2614655 RepID=A0A7J5TSA8_9BACT|nr:hypothetical protein [Rudanella paleaurantiibacter]KAB7725981.1 hypothetical protein F5984_25320 [Rudanella paleaurantiibacter]
MIYFSTDVLVNYHVEQVPVQHQQARHLYQQAIQRGQAFISLLTLNELVFVLTQLHVDEHDIALKMSKYHALTPAGVSAEHFKRAVQLAERVGFGHITECLHTAIAESHCHELYTYNRPVFTRIQPYSPLNIVCF